VSLKKEISRKSAWQIRNKTNDPGCRCCGSSPLPRGVCEVAVQLAMPTAPKRRWLRFSIRTMFVAFTVVAMWLGWNVHAVRQRQAKLAELQADIFRVVVSTRAEHDALYPNISNEPMLQVSIVRRLLGDEPVYWINFLPLWGVSDAEFDATADLFPEARVEAMWRADREPTQ
jgi:hypothetical protein